MSQLTDLESSRTPTSKRAATRAMLHDHERDILDALSNLSNTVIANEAARSLGRRVVSCLIIGWYISLILLPNASRIRCCPRGLFFALPTPLNRYSKISPTRDALTGDSYRCMLACVPVTCVIRVAMQIEDSTCSFLPIYPVSSTHDASVGYRTLSSSSAALHS